MWNGLRDEHRRNERKKSCSKNKRKKAAAVRSEQDTHVVGTHDPTGNKQNDKCSFRD